MLRAAFSIIGVCLLSAALQAGDAVHSLRKEQLQCLYTQADSLLSEPADPVIVLLQCAPPHSAQQPPPGNEKTPLVEFAPPIDAEKPTVSPNDVVTLRKAQLVCFKQKFAELMQYTQEPIAVFSEHCPEKGVNP